MDILGTVIALIGAIATVLSVVVLYLKSRSESKSADLNAKNAESNAKNALDARIDARVTEQLTAAWAEIDKLKENFRQLQDRQTRRDKAITNIFKSIAKQWPGSSGPILDPQDIIEIEDTVPDHWITSKVPLNSKNK